MGTKHHHWGTLTNERTQSLSRPELALHFHHHSQIKLSLLLLFYMGLDQGIRTRLSVALVHLVDFTGQI